MPFSPNDAEKLFAEKLSAEEYAKGINLLIDEVIKTDPSKSYNLFLRSLAIPNRIKCMMCQSLL